VSINVRDLLAQDRIFTLKLSLGFFKAFPNGKNMRSEMRSLALGVLVAALLTGCGQFTDQIGDTVKISMQ
jgi:hypothetical protein